MIKKTLFLAICLFTFSKLIFGQIVQPDSSFGNNGYVKPGIKSDGTNPYGDDMEINAEGEIFIGGGINFEDAKVFKLKPNGQIDHSFTFLLQNANTEVVPLAFQKNGKLLVKSGTKILRYFASGDPDSTFGVAGVLQLTEPGWRSNLLVLEDDNFIVYGTAYLSPDADDFILLKFLKDGTTDSTFADNGKFTFDFYPQIDDDINFGYSMSQFSDGKLLIGGSIYKSGFKAGLVKLNVDGTLDSTFADNGSFLSGYLQSAECYKTVITPDDKIMFAGYTIQTYPDYQGLIVRLNTDGSPDLDFGDDGQVLLPGVWEHTTLALRGDRILYGGYMPYPDTFYAYVGGLHYDGTPDTIFGPSGVFKFNKPSKAREIIIQDDNTAVVSGHYTYDNGFKVVARLLLSPIISGTQWSENQQPDALIYPNPVAEMLHISLPGFKQEKVGIKIVDMAGREWCQLQQTVENESINIPLDNSIAAGEYVVVMSTGNKTLALKIYKQ